VSKVFYFLCIWIARKGEIWAEMVWFLLILCGCIGLMVNALESLLNASYWPTYRRSRWQFDHFILTCLIWANRLRYWLGLVCRVDRGGGIWILLPIHTVTAFVGRWDILAEPATIKTNKPLLLISRICHLKRNASNKAMTTFFSLMYRDIQWANIWQQNNHISNSLRRYRNVTGPAIWATALFYIANSFRWLIDRYQFTFQFTKFWFVIFISFRIVLKNRIKARRAYFIAGQIDGIYTICSFIQQFSLKIPTL